MPRKLLRAALLGAGLMWLPISAHAVPLLQLDIQDGYYDFTESTIVASGNPFTLYAIATHDGTTQGAKYTLQRLLSETFYISAAVRPQVFEPGANLGSFTVNGQVVDVTEDMVFGQPPIEVWAELQGFDRGDLAGHNDIFPTFFTDFAFKFVDTPDARVDTYDTSVNPGGPTFNALGNSLAVAFVIDTTNLNPNFVLHFDMYNEAIKKCGAAEAGMVPDPACTDVDSNQYAPFAHDAQSPPVPEPATMVLFGTGLAAGAYRKYRNRRSQAAQQ